MGKTSDGTVTVLASPPGARRLVWFAAAVTGGLCAAALIAAAVLVATGNVAAGAALVPLSAVHGGLFLYVLRDARGKQGWRIEIGSGSLHLDLPAGRSLARRLEPLRVTIRFDEIAAVESRLEAYRSLGMVNMLRAQALRLKTGEIVILGEDRALGTGLATDSLEAAAGQIAARAGVPRFELDMVEGRTGVLMLWPTAPVPWDAAALTAPRRDAAWRNAAAVGRFAVLASVVVLILALVSALS